MNQYQTIIQNILKYEQRQLTKWEVNFLKKCLRFNNFTLKRINKLLKIRDRIVKTDNLIIKDNSKIIDKLL